MSLTDEQVFQNFDRLVKTWGKANSPSDTFPTNQSDNPTNPDYALITTSPGNTEIEFWNHDSPEPTIADLKALTLQNANRDHILSSRRS